jgi:uncharacterized membrane protein (DUF4010 family)
MRVRAVAVQSRVFGNRKDFDQHTSLAHRFMRNKAARVLWYVMVLLIAAFQIMMFLRRRQPFFHSTLEMVLVFALLAVFLLGILVKSREGPQDR